MDLSKPIFNASKDEIWETFAESVSGTLETSNLSKDIKVTAKAGDWTVTLDSYEFRTQHNTITYTRLRAPFVNKDGFRFTIYKESIIDDIKKMLGMQDIKTGFCEFDNNYIIQGNDTEKVQQLFSNPAIRGLITDQPGFYMEVKDDDGYFSESFPDGVDELYCLIQDEVTSLEQLQGLFNLFAEVLNTLCHLGSAYEDDPQLCL
jgi:hypothetical protein